MFKVYGDIKDSRNFDYDTLGNTYNLFKLIGINPKEFNGIYDNDEGDDFTYLFKEINDAISFAFCVQDSCKYFDWRAVGHKRGPQYRISITESTFTKRDDNRYTGAGHALGVELSKKTKAGEISISHDASLKIPSTKYLVIPNDELDFFSSKKEYKNNGYLYTIGMGKILQTGLTLPLYDQQRIEREDALRRFAYSWLILDQLPGGSWGRSVAPWMKGVWKDLTNMSVNPLMEEEGGFETTILNMNLLCTILGTNDFHKFYLNSSLEYLKSRQGFDGHFGPTSMSRQGLELATHARHTALALWLIGKHFFTFTVSYQDSYFKGLRALFLKDDISELLANENEQNPVLLYVVCCDIIKFLESDKFRKVKIKKENRILIDSIILKWNLKGEDYLRLVLSPSYIRNGVQVHVNPYTSPYGGFQYLEMYSFLTACNFISEDTDSLVKDRFRDGLENLLDTYFHSYDWEKFYSERYTIDALHTKIRGLPATISGGDSNLGTISLFLSVLRDDELVSCIWEDRLTKKLRLRINKAIYYLHEDLVDQFDRYLVTHTLYDCVNAGMFASFLIRDDIPHLKKTLKKIIEFQFPEKLKDINSEYKISKFIKERVITNEKCQVASISLERLLLYFNNPGRYHVLKDEEIADISEQTLSVYREDQFVEKFASKWNDIGDIFPPFLNKLDKKSTILDLGCGSGQYTLELLKAEHDVSILDGSNKMLECAKKRIEAYNEEFDEEYSVSNIYNINVLSEKRWAKEISKDIKFDAIWCSGLFAHIPVSAHGTVLGELSSLLNDNGKLFINIMIKNPRVVAYDGRYFAYNKSAEEFNSKLKKNKLTIDYYIATTISKNTYDEPHIESQWINYYVQKPIIKDPQVNHSILTAHAYQRSVPEFIDVHLKKKPKDRTEIITNTLSQLRKYIKDYQYLDLSQESIHVLDAGCGPGDYVSEMVGKFGWYGYGIDISNKMIEYASSIHCTKSHLINYQIGDISNIHKIHSESKFNAIISVTVFQHLNVKKAVEVLQSFYKVLKKDGIVRIDVQFKRHSGYDPDLRFIEHYSGIKDVINKIRFDKIGFEIIDTEPWELEKEKNTFERPVKFEFCNFWLKKI